MKAISKSQFVANPEMYLDMARKHDEVRIRRGRGMFTLVYTPPADEQPLRAPDDKLRSAITGEELKKRMRVSIHKFFADKK